MSMQQRKTIQSWQAPFRTEDDVTRSFVVNVDKLIASVADLESKLGRQIEDLNFAKSKHTEWKSAEGRTGTNGFLMPAVQAAPSLAEALLREGRTHEGFWVCNIFGEMCKI